MKRRLICQCPTCDQFINKRNFRRHCRRLHDLDVPKNFAFRCLATEQSTPLSRAVEGRATDQMDGSFDGAELHRVGDATSVGYSWLVWRTTMARKLCECGNPATQKLYAEWVCARCMYLDGNYSGGSRVIAALRIAPRLNIYDLQSIACISEPTARRAIRQLLASGRLRRLMADEGQSHEIAYYELVSHEKEKMSIVRS